MTTKLYLITHGEVGHAMLSAVTHTLKQCPLETKAIPIHYDCDPEDICNTLEGELNQHPSDDILILTDLIGSTPSNIACHFKSRAHTKVVTGVNIPMLLKVMNYSHLELDQLAQKAIDGGHNGVMRIQ